MTTPQSTHKRATDWNRYYQSVPASAKLTRQYTTAVLLKAIRRFVTPPAGGRISIVEIGGANSCFLDAVVRAENPAAYHVADTNEYGLSLLARRAPAGIVRLHQRSVLDLNLDEQADLVYSVGLIEHFDPPETRKAVLAHFQPLKRGSIVIVTFPTPTLLYRIARRLIEWAGMWQFPDERPLKPAEVLASIAECGDVLFQKTLWPLILTQHMIVARKR